ncbi:MAG: hypothetical protein JW999_08140 [Methanotrichaceae archaeon]|nr:hypothetical protein [Methanotrichaceae archaeon]
MVSSQCVIKEDDSYQELFGFNETLKTIQESIDKLQIEGRSNIAIVSEPFSGSSELLGKVAGIRPENTTKIYLRRLVKDKTLFEALTRSGGIVLVDNCHFLYMRKIGGFQMLDDFLNLVASSSKLFITTWNIYTWNYLSRLFPLQQIFPTKIELPKLNSQDLKEMIMSSCEWEMSFEEEQTSQEEKILQFTRTPFEVKPLNRTLQIPVPTFDYAALKSRLPDRFNGSKKKETVSVEDKVFNRLLDHSEGNPGVAKAIWMRSVSRAEGAIKPGDIIKPQHKIDLNYDQAFLLYIILCMERISIEELKDIIDPNADVNRSVHDLKKNGLISVENELLSIMPEALHSIESYLKSMQLVW